MSLIKGKFRATPLDEVSAFRHALGQWFAKDGKDYPWRRTRDPYAILVSEMMLQQTRLGTVLGKGYYHRFLETFPTLASLAKADDPSLLKAWEGLGYYRRARMLRATAQAIMAEHGGVFPSDEAALLALPGIGYYTSAALLSFAFGKSSALVDGNVSRVLSRLMDDASCIDAPATQKLHRQWALALCDPAEPARHNHAMMELGQSICRNGSPLCELCPVQSFCKTQAPEDLPNRKKRVEITPITEHAVWAKNADGHILLHQESGSRRRGLWKLPLRSEQECAAFPIILSSSYGITRYKVSLHVHLASEIELQEGDEWLSEEQLPALAMAAPFRKALEKLLSES
jgi:A/G-specific adenine glycosylase